MAALREHPLLDAAPVFSHVSGARLCALNLMVAIAYAVSGYAGLKLAFVAHAVTLFWPPSGLGFAAVWLGGLRLLPGVFLGAFMVNLLELRSPLLALLIGAGNMLPSLIATLGLRALLRREPEAGALKRLVMFILVAVLGATMASATAGTLTISAIGRLGDSVATTWLVWWMGDAMGVMIVAPPILLWRRVATAQWRGRVVVEILLFALAGLAIIAALLLIDKPIWAVELCKLCTLLLSLLAGARFGLNGPAWMTLLMACGTVGVTVMGAGPFLRGDFYDSFAFVHSYLFAEAVAGMLLAAALSDLRSTVQREIAARAEAEAAAVNRIRLLAMISHDVRTPLSGIMGVLQTLARENPAPAQARLLGLGVRAGMTLTTLVSDILDVARADSGRITLDIAAFSPVLSLGDIVDMHRAAALAKGLTLELHCDAGLPALALGDRIRFEQIIGNLVSNAVLYTREGGVRVSARWGQSLQFPLTVAVVDSGPGIDPQRVPQVADLGPGVLAPGNRSAGLGLGLHICRRLVDLMQGQLTHVAVPEGGSCFRVCLPLQEVPNSTAQPAPVAAIEARLRILLVEDDEIAGEASLALLGSCGHDVMLTVSANIALAYAAEQCFDVILLDMQLSPHGMSGLDIARQIRALPAPHGDARLFAVTGDGFQENHVIYRAAGIDGLILKPLMVTETFAASLQAAEWRPLTDRTATAT
jgi:signal transduction histidine kinase/ActR/RegA family two-component response regulator